MASDREALEEQFYNSLEEADTLVDYFGVVGLDQEKLAEMVGWDVAANG